MAEDIAGPLRFVGAEAARRVQQARRHVPAGARLQAIGLGQIGDAVVALVPDLQTVQRTCSLVVPGSRPKKVWGKLAPWLFSCGGKIVGLRLGLLAHGCGMLRHLVQVMGQWRPCCRRTWNRSARRRSASHSASPSSFAPRSATTSEEQPSATDRLVARRRRSSGLRPAWSAGRCPPWWWMRTSARRCRRGARRRRSSHAGCSLMRRPGMQNDRGTQVGARRKDAFALFQGTFALGQWYAPCFLTKRLVEPVGQVLSFLYVSIDRTGGSGRAIARGLATYRTLFIQR